MCWGCLVDVVCPGLSPTCGRIKVKENLQPVWQLSFKGRRLLMMKQKLYFQFPIFKNLYFENIYFESYENHKNENTKSRIYELNITNLYLTHIVNAKLPKFFGGASGTNWQVINSSGWLQGRNTHKLAINHKSGRAMCQLSYYMHFIIMVTKPIIKTKFNVST